MTKGEYIKYAIQKTVSEYSFLEWLEIWDIEEKDWNKFMSGGSKAVSQEENEKEQEPCGKDINVSATDTVSRQAVLDMIDNSLKIIDEYKVCEKSLNWIPVSERLPEEDCAYLITSRSGINILSFAKDLYKIDEYDFWDKKGVSGWFDYDSEYGYIEIDGVTAWIPLPSNYKESEWENANSN